MNYFGEKGFGLGVWGAGARGFPNGKQPPKGGRIVGPRPSGGTPWGRGAPPARFGLPLGPGSGGTGGGGRPLPCPRQREKRGGEKNPGGHGRGSGVPRGGGPGGTEKGGRGGPGARAPDKRGTGRGPPAGPKTGGRGELWGTFKGGRGGGGKNPGEKQSNKPNKTLW